MKKNVLGVKIDDITMNEAIKKVEGWLSKPENSPHHYIVTINPEILVAAQKNNLFKKILNSADLSIPDGVGLKLSGIKNTVTGTDLMENLVKLASDLAFTIGLLGGRDQVAEKTAERLKKKYPGLKVTFTSNGGEINQDGANVILNPSLRSRVNSVKDLSRMRDSNKLRDSSLIAQNDIPQIDILFVAFGHLKQEIWIAKNLPKLDVKVAMGVGGAFDYISGKVPRAPKWVRNLGMEWLFRLIVQPWRIKRQLALIKFIWYVLANHSNNMIR